MEMINYPQGKYYFYKYVYNYHSSFVVKIENRQPPTMIMRYIVDYYAPSFEEKLRLWWHLKMIETVLRSIIYSFKNTALNKSVDKNL